MNLIRRTRLYQEIHEQPQIIQSLLSESQDAIKTLANEIQSRHIQHVFVAARGTSDNAGRYAKYLLGAHNHLDVSLATPSLFTIYQQPPNLKDSLVMGISQSGKSPDIVSVLKEGQRQGALTAALTNYPASDLGQSANIVIDLQAGEEVSLAATKTYTSQLTNIALLSTQLSFTNEYQHQLEKLPDQVNELIKNENHVEKLAERYRYMAHCAVIGRGFNYATAFEFSLKLKELTYTIAEPYSSADFLHGPVALIDRGFPIFIIAPSGAMVPRMRALVEKVHNRQAEVILLSDQKELLSKVNQKIPLPIGIPEWLSPITTILPAQMFAMYLAHTRELNVDNPRGLNKVTETW